MPTKRQLPDETPASPPPAQRQALETGQHLSPQAGHHPDSPEGGAAASAAPPSPESPIAAAGGGARAAHHASHQQKVITCNLSLIPPSKCYDAYLQLLMPIADAHQRIRLSGIVLVVYAPQQGPPARMYMLVGDGSGVAGVTVWGDTVSQLTGTANLIGQAVVLPGCTMSFYNGKRSLNVPRNHVVAFPNDSPHAQWWASKLQTAPLTTQQLLAEPDHAIVSIFAVCSGIRREEKTMRKQCHHQS
jgi:hypothetical protein